MEKPKQIIIDGRPYEYTTMQMSVGIDEQTGEHVEKITIYDTDNGIFTVPLRRAEFCEN